MAKPPVLERARRAVFDPKTSNRVVGGEVGKSTALGGRAPATAKQVTHAQRQVSAAELESIKKTGYATPPKKGSRFTQGGKDKWWSAADEQGKFGRNWNKGGDGAQTVRAKVKDVPANRAVRARNLEVKVGDAWQPVKPRPGAAAATAARTALGRAGRLAGPAALVATGLGAYDATIGADKRARAKAKAAFKKKNPDA